MNSLLQREPLRILSKIIQLFSLTKNLNREQWNIVYKDLWSVITKDISLLLNHAPLVQIWQIERSNGFCSLLATSIQVIGNLEIPDRSVLSHKGSVFDIDDNSWYETFEINVIYRIAF